MIYLDHAATTPIHEQVQEVLIRALSEYGNPSSGYNLGKKSKSMLELARYEIEESLNLKHGTFFFTSGGSEANNMAIHMGAELGRNHGRNKVLYSAVEHHSVINSIRSLPRDMYYAEKIHVTKDGQLDESDLKQKVSSEVSLVSVMDVNNETGIRLSRSTLHREAGANGCLVHMDAVQSLPHGQFHHNPCYAFISFSGHKIGAPKGLGGIYIREDLQEEILENRLQLIAGGGQEKGFRAGTENVPYALAFAEAVKIRKREKIADHVRLKVLREYAKTQILNIVPFATINEGQFQSPSILNISLHNVDGASVVEWMNLHDICIASGSACNTGSNKPSHVLTAMGLSERDAFSSIRLSFDVYTSTTDIDKFVSALKKYANKYLTCKY